jgi:hypothetical protein
MAGEPVSVGQVSTDDVSSLLTQAPGPTLYFVWEEKEMAIEYLGETIVALANNQGGHILIGVRPLPEGGTCQILGIEELKAKEVMSRVSNAAAGCRPPVQIFGPKLLVMEGKNVVVVKIAGGLPYVYSFAGRVLTRREADNENPADAIYQQVIERSRTTVRELSDEVRPVASYIRLDWPYVSYVTAASARFDPEKRALEWRDLFLQPEGEDHYRCKVSIPIERPKELYRQREIKGEIRLQFRNVTLSGLRLDYFNALGEGRRSPHALLGDLPKLERIGRAVSAQQSAGVEIERFAKGWGRSQLQALRDSLHKLERAGRTRSTQQPAKVKIERSTTIIVDTAITVDSIFKRREFFPYRHVELGGIIPEPNRLNDILNILNDLGIRVEIWPDPATGSEAFLKQMEHGFQISGVKRTGAEELKVSMVVKGFRSGLTRQVTLGRRKDTLRLNTGNLVIDIFGSVQGDFKQLSALLSEIQKVLKERLEFVRVT